MIVLSWTEDKSRLGANAIVGVSMAVARVFASITDAGYAPGREGVAVALDPAIIAKAISDDFIIADLAVGSGCGQIKSGAPARGERVAEYNRLTQTETEARAPYGI